MKTTLENINNNFSYVILDDIPKDMPLVNCFNTVSPWNEFLEGMKIHLGKQSSGWKFVWNFHKNKYYHDKETLFAFIRSGRVVDEYGNLIDNEEFIKEALEWGEPDGWIYNDDYIKAHPNQFGTFNMSEYYSRMVDGLVVSPNDEFC